MNDKEKQIHKMILDSILYKITIDLSDFDRYKILKDLLYEIDEMITESEE